MALTILGPGREPRVDGIEGTHTKDLRKTSLRGEEGYKGSYPSRRGVMGSQYGKKTR